MKKIKMVLITLFSVITFCFSSCSDDNVAVTSITLNKSTITLKKGSSETLLATVQPEDATNKNYVWKSSDQTIASVSSQGVVTALKAGTATISVTTEEGTFSTSCKVDVIVDVSSLQLSLTQLSIIKGTVKKIDANILPEDATNKNVIWKSSDESVVSVDNDGNVKALKVGNAIITAIAEDQGIEAKCDVKVSSSEDIKYNPYGDSENW